MTAPKNKGDKSHYRFPVMLSTISQIVGAGTQNNFHQLYLYIIIFDKVQYQAATA